LTAGDRSDAATLSPQPCRFAPFQRRRERGTALAVFSESTPALRGECLLLAFCREGHGVDVGSFSNLELL
jgi:hypothetical protein